MAQPGPLDPTMIPEDDLLAAAAMMQEQPTDAPVEDAAPEADPATLEEPIAGGLQISEEERQVLLKKIEAAREELEIQREFRAAGRNAYFRQPLGNETEGRSQVIASDVFNHVESTHPHLMKQFLATDHKIAIIGPDDKIGDALKQMCREAIHDQGGFRLISDVLKDGEISANGSAKVWWSRIWGVAEEHDVPELNEQDLLALEKDVRFQLHEIIPNPIRQAMVDDGIIDPRTGRTTQMLVQGKPTWRVRMTFTPLEESGPVIAAMPPEELICERGKIRINDRKGVGHRTLIAAGVLLRENERLSMPTEPYYTNLRRAIDAAGNQSGTAKEDDERREREQLSYSVGTQQDYWTDADLRKECEVIEWSDWVASGGKLVPATVTFCNGEIIRAESNEDGIIPICTWSPVVNPHSIYGLSLAWMHADDQNLRTVLFRALLDSVAFSIDKPWLVSNRGTDLLALQNLTPGQLVFGSEGDAKAIEIEPIDARLFGILEYIKAEGEERGPGTRYNMGTDSDSLNKTATGVSLIQRASMSKIEMIAMAFSELFLVDLYNKLIFLFQHNLDLPKTVTVDGETRQITKDMIQGDYRARSDLGVVVDFDDREFARSQALMSMALKASERYPMLFPLRTVYEHLKKPYLAAGIKNVGDFIAAPPQQMENWFPGLPIRPGGPPQQGRGKPVGKPQPPRPPQIQTGIPGKSLPVTPMARAVPKADGVSGQATAQPDETMLGR